MADWFRFYENAIDEPRLATAITELPEVLPVFVLILSEHCRHKNPTLTWSGDEYELRGFARKVGVTVEKFKEALLLLANIRYIEVKDGSLTTIRWNDLQSDYCQRKTRIQMRNDKRVSEHPPASVRQEDKREDKRRIKKGRPAPVAAIIPDALNTEMFLGAWADWRKHRNEIRKPMTPTAERQQLKALEAMGAERAITALQYSMANGWQGIFEPKISVNGMPGVPKAAIVDREVEKLRRSVERGQS